jgi:hypothetical protein
MTQEQRDSLYAERVKRLGKLIRLNAPQPIIELAAETLLLTPYTGKSLYFWRWLFSLAYGRILRLFRDWRVDIGILRLRSL